jgi:hypothetical protein
MAVDYTTTRRGYLTMGKLRIAAGVIAMLLLGGPVHSSPFAFGHVPQHPWIVAQRDHARNGGLSLDEAINRTRRSHDGKVLSADTVGDNGNRVHRIRILTPDGRVKRFRLDAGNGKKKQKR